MIQYEELLSRYLYTTGEACCYNSFAQIPCYFRLLDGITKNIYRCEVVSRFRSETSGYSMPLPSMAEEIVRIMIQYEDHCLKVDTCTQQVRPAVITVLLSIPCYFRLLDGITKKMIYIR